jgi:hypothetical protein
MPNKQGILAACLMLAFTANNTTYSTWHWFSITPFFLIYLMLAWAVSFFVREMKGYSLPTDYVPFIQWKVPYLLWGLVFLWALATDLHWI